MKTNEKEVIALELFKYLNERREDIEIICDKSNNPQSVINENKIIVELQKKREEQVVMEFFKEKGITDDHTIEHILLLFNQKMREARKIDDKIKDEYDEMGLAVCNIMRKHIYENWDSQKKEVTNMEQLRDLQLKYFKEKGIEDPDIMTEILNRSKKFI